MNIPEGYKLVPVVPTEEMLSVLHDRVLISVNTRKQEANILNDKAWWSAVVAAAPAQPQPAAHLTIPGALEWDGDNGTHGVVGTHGADGESHADGELSELDRLRALSVTNILMAVTPGFDGMGCEHYAQSVGEVEQKLGELSEQTEDLRTQLANTEQSRRSFFDLSQDLEKMLAYMVEAMNQIVQVSIMYEKPFEIATLAIGEMSAMVVAPASRAEIDPFAATEAPYVPLSASEVEAFMSMGDGNKVKPKTCIECDQPYCHGVCVERGDQDYDRDQAAKGGDDE